MEPPVLCACISPKLQCVQLQAFEPRAELAEMFKALGLPIPTCLIPWKSPEGTLSQLETSHRMSGYLQLHGARIIHLYLHPGFPLQ